VGVRRAGEISEHEERRVVTVLFADLAGSTALGERLEPEDVRTLQGELFELVNAEVERYGGLSEKFVGDAVLAVFGVPQTHEDDAERGVRAALAIRDAFPAFAARVGDRHGGEIGLRIGVNTGDVISGREAAARGELVVSGDAVNVAARLQQLADPGTILVGERTRSATHKVIAYGEPGAFDAKGKSEPLVGWTALADTAPMHEQARGQRAPLIGREDEISMLRLAAARVRREQEPQLITIFGQAGVGKSRLLAEFTEELDGARVVVGRCVPYGDGITYLPLVEVASALAGIRDDDRNDVALAKLRSSVEASLPADHVDRVVAAIAWTIGLTLPGRATGVALDEDVQRRLHDAWTRYLAGLGREVLLVLVIDDIHWASGPLLDLLDDVIAGLEQTTVLILCPSRPELLDRQPSWGTGRLASSSLTLAPLTPRHAEMLLRALLDTDALPAHVADAILEPAEGNPFFVEELLAMLVEQGALEEREGRWSVTDGLGKAAVPDSIHGVIAARIDLLEAFERDAMRRCSVMGRFFWPSAVGIDDDVLFGLGRRGLVFEQPEASFSGRREFAFKHALTHEVAYATLPRVERRDLHRRVAEWISDSVPDRQAETTEVIAYHFEQALRYGERDEDLEHRAFEALLTAGEAAVRRGAYASAEGLLGRALEIAPTKAMRARALLSAARADLATRKFERATTRLEKTIREADLTGDASLRADALGWKGRVSWLRGDWRDALESTRAAVATLEGLPESAELARALARLSQIEMLRALPDAESTATRAIEVAKRTGEQGAEANARTNLLTVRGAQGIAPEESDLADTIELARAAGAHDEAARAVVNYLWSAALLGPLEPAEEVVRNAIRNLDVGLAAEAYESYLQLSLAALVYVPAGRWKEADEVLAAGEVTESASGRLVWLWLVSGQALRRGDLELTDRHLPELREVALASEEPQRIVPMAGVAMPRAILAGDSDAVSQLADIVLALPSQWLMASSMLAIVRSLAAVEDRDRLERLIRALEEPLVEAQQDTVKVARGLVTRLDGRAADANGLILEGADGLDRLGRHYDAACAALEAATAAEASGEIELAAAARTRATTLLDTLGCVNPY
jgi:class 3 adenylate cyclase